MASQQPSPPGSSGHLAYRPLPDDGLVPQTLEFVRTQLPAWRDDPSRPQDSSEKRLNSSLCGFLDSRARFHCPMVRFQHESPQTRASTVDVGIHGIEEITIGARSYTIYEAFMVIEAKRLPAPSKDREREYVTGTTKTSGGATGGIQRFKLGLHGANVGTAVLVGYIQKHSARYWHEKINRWITDLVAKTSSDGCVWNQSDTLAQLVCNDDKGTSTTESIHERSDVCLTPSIRIHHLWVILS